MPLSRECSKTQVLWSDASTALRLPILMPDCVFGVRVRVRYSQLIYMRIDMFELLARSCQFEFGSSLSKVEVRLGNVVCRLIAMIYLASN